MKHIASIRILSGLFALAFGFAAQAADGLTVLHRFTWEDGDGVFPSGSLVQGSDDALYGTTSRGGAYDRGEVYRVDTNGNITILHSFGSRTDGPGSVPRSGVTLMDDGAIYGVADTESIFDYAGTVFRLAPDGGFTTLHTFPASGAMGTIMPLTASRDGLLYGTTTYGGTSDEGTAYAMGTDGTYIQLAEFNGANGSRPQGALTEAADGNFYGTTTSGGEYNHGTVFRMTPDGIITTLHEFRDGDVDGAFPIGKLVQGDDGRFYGATNTYYYNGNPQYGTLYAITVYGELTTLYTFHGFDGITGGTFGGLVQGDDGFLYGATYGGGYLGFGTLFRLSMSGQLTTLHLFTEQEGMNPASTPLIGNDGRLYGTTTSRYPDGNGNGVIYAFDLAARTPELYLCNSYYFSPYAKCRTSFTAHVRTAYTLDWHAANVAACKASGAWNGIRRRSGSIDFQATEPGTFVYRLDCTGPNGHASAQVVVKVIPR